MRCAMSESASARVRIDDGVVFGTGGGRELRCDVYTPPAGTANGVGVLLVHGGGWVQGDRSQLRGYGILLGRLGYTSVACEYRLADEAPWPAQLHDVKAALRWMRANGAALGIDADKIAVSGNSAGGHLSLMVAGTPDLEDFEGDGGNPGVGTAVRASIAFYAPTNLAPRVQRGSARPDGEGPELADVVARLFGADRSPARIRAASPIAHAKSSFPPTLLVTGNSDSIVAPSETLRMYEALVAAGARAEVHVYEGAPHAFDAVPEFGRQCAGIMALFLDRHLVRPRPIAVP